MIYEISPLLAKTAISVKPEDILLQKGAWVKFSSAWPGTHKWASGKLFVVSAEPILVPYAISRIIPEDDYCDIDLSNSDSGEKLYPENEGVLYQIAVGMKPGDYLVHFYLPSPRYIYHLGEASMFPDVASSTLRYLGAKRPEDSPADAPLWFLFAIKDMPPITLRPYVETGGDDATQAFEKCTFMLKINKCLLDEVKNPSKEQIERAFLIRWRDELLGY